MSIEPRIDNGAMSSLQFKHFTHHSTSRWSHRLSVFLGVSIGSIAYQSRMTEKGLEDVFHFGEYFVGELNVINPLGNRTPLLIHGLMNVIPASISRAVFGGSSYFFPTWLSFRILEVVAALLFTTIAISLRKDSKPSRFYLFTIALLGSLVVGYREILLLLSLFFLVKLWHSRGGCRDILTTIALVITLWFGVFWSWNRGIVAVAAVGVGFLLTIQSRFLRLLGVGVGLVALFMGSFISPLTSPSFLLENLLFFTDTSGKWRYPLHQTRGLLAFMGIYLIMSAIALVHLLYSSTSKKRAFGEAWVFVVLIGGASTWAINRLDAAHFLPMLFPVLLLVLRVSGEVGIKKSQFRTILGIQILYVVGSAALFLSFLQPTISGLALLSVLVTTAARPTHWTRFIRFLSRSSLIFLLFNLLTFGNQPQLTWLTHIRNLPTNQEVSPNWVVDASKELKAQGVHCVLDLTNSGLVNGLLNLPTCTRVAYLAYASDSYQVELINQVNENKPRAILWSTRPGLSASVIDGRTIVSEFPKFTKYLFESFPVIQCYENFCLRLSG